MRPLPVYFTVYKDRGNTIRPLVTVRDDDGVETSLAWTNVTRMVLSIRASTPVTVDTAVNPTAIDYSVAGELTLAIGELASVKALAEGDYYARLTAYDAAGNETEIWHEDHPETPVILRLRDA